MNGKELLKTNFISENYGGSYIVSESKKHLIHFSKHQLLVMYQLIRFSYFDREIFKNIDDMISSQESISSKLFQSYIGGNNFPLSVYPDFKDGRKKIYFVNRKFANWIFENLEKFDFISNYTAVTEFKNSIYSIESNKLYGGKPQTVNIHDLNTRRVLSNLGKTIAKKLPELSREKLNIQFSFPTSRKRIAIVPDAAIFVCGVCHFVEYDRNTESQERLLSKLYGYIKIPYYKGSNIFIIFDEITPKQKILLPTRPRNFLRNIHSQYFLKGSYTYYEKLKHQGIDLILSPIYFASEEVSHFIIKHLNLDKYLISDQSMIVPPEIPGLEIKPLAVYKKDKENLDYLVVLYDVISDEKTYPLVLMTYGHFDMINILENIYNQYKDDYPKILVGFSEGLEEQDIKLPHDDYFKAVFV